MKIIKIESYTDGGTIEIKTNRGCYCIDNRVFSKTKGIIFCNYPENDNSNIAPNQDELKLELIDALEKYNVDENSPHWLSRAKKLLNMDAAYQHLKYFHEGYRDRMLTLLHGDNFAEERMGIDTDRYAVGSARRFSYDEGWELAAKDYDNKSEKIKVYHGSDKENLPFLKRGTWITESEETARSFGKYVYVLHVEDNDVAWEYLSPDMCDWDTNEQGEWRGELKKDFTVNEIN